MQRSVTISEDTLSSTPIPLGDILQRKYRGRLKKHYPTMSIDELCALPVAEIAALDSALFMWAILAKQLGISEYQLSYITHSNSGEGLLFYGNVTIPFVDRFPRGEIYDLLTTRPEDMAHERTNQ